MLGRTPILVALCIALSAIAVSPEAGALQNPLPGHLKVYNNLASDGNGHCTGNITTYYGLKTVNYPLAYSIDWNRSTCVATVATGFASTNSFASGYVDITACYIAAYPNAFCQETIDHTVYVNVRESISACVVGVYSLDYDQDSNDWYGPGVSNHVSECGEWKELEFGATSSAKPPVTITAGIVGGAVQCSVNEVGFTSTFPVDWTWQDNGMCLVAGGTLGLPAQTWSLTTQTSVSAGNVGDYSLA